MAQQPPLLYRLLEANTMIKGFRDFLMRGNVVDLAVAVVIGAAFGAVVEGFLNGLVNPLIAAVFGSPNLDSVGQFTIGKGEFAVGLFLTPLVNFLIVAAAIYFFVVVPMNKINEMRARGKEAAAEETPEDIALLTDIRDLLRQR